MLKSNQGEIRIQGTKLDLLAEFSMLVTHLLNQHVFDDDDIQLCLETAKKSDAEKQAKVDEIEQNVGKDVMEFIMHLLSD